MMIGVASVEIVGREAELAAIERFTRSDAGGARSLLLTGPAGIGKTTLWRYATEQCRQRGYRVLVAAPAEAERELPFAALNDLLAEVLEECGESLPERRREALEAALLRSTRDAAAGRLAVALAVFDLLHAAAAARPVAIAVDDAQWLDAPSAAALHFALRRLQDDAVLLICSEREPASMWPLGFDRDRTTRLEIGSLSATALGRIIAAHTGEQFGRPLLLRLEEMTGGSPFFALELARTLGSGSLAPDVFAVPATVAELLRERIASLSRECRDTLLFVAALGQPMRASLDRVAPERAEALREALDAGILESDQDRIRFTHPMLASAIYASAPPQQRRDIHRAIAQNVGDPQQRALHLAHGTDGADERIAATIERAAAEAAKRGAPETAAELAEHARRLTPPGDVAVAGRRALAAAAFTWSAGDARRSEQMLGALISELPHSPLRAQARQLLPKIVDDLARTIAELQLALDESGTDAAVHASVLNLLARQRTWAGDTAGAIRDAIAAASVAEQAGVKRELAVALGRENAARAYAGEPTSPRQLERALALERELDAPLPIDESPTFFRGVCALWEDDLETARTCLEAVDDRAARLGESWRLVVLTHLIEIEVRAGDAVRSLRYAAEAEEIGSYWGVGHAAAAAHAAAAMAKAVAGPPDEARVAAKAALDAMQPHGYEIVTRPAERALGHVELALGNAAAAHAVLAPLLARAPIGCPPVTAAAVDEIEALLELGLMDEARTLLARLDDFARTSGRPRVKALAMRCAGLLTAYEGNLETAAGAVRAAIHAQQDFTDTLELGRSWLTLGVINRRRKLKAEAREALAQALELFEHCGAALWANRAGNELRRTGPPRSTASELTPTEQRIATLASSGATNREIAAQLFITVKTVEANLSRIYGKIGVRSRTELASSLRSDLPRSESTSVNH
jgi:DNA-binding NarL/FixJ family response regulator